MTAGGYGPRAYLCSCGKVVHGNLAKASHRKACTDGHYYSERACYDMRVFAFEMARDDKVKP